jgi:hypothetical protein
MPPDWKRFRLRPVSQPDCRSQGQAQIRMKMPVWLIARRGRYRARTCRAMEISTLFAICGLYVVMGMSLPIGFRPDYLVLLIMTMIMSIRSIVVPSTARQSALLATAP